MRAIIFEVAQERGAIDGSFPFQYTEKVEETFVEVMGRDVAQLDGLSAEEVGRRARVGMLLCLDRVREEGGNVTMSQTCYLLYEICYLCSCSPRANFYVRDVAWWYPNP